MWIRKVPKRQGLDAISDSGQVASQFILRQTLPSHIHWPGSACLHHLGEVPNLLGIYVNTSLPADQGVFLMRYGFV